MNNPIRSTPIPWWWRDHVLFPDLDLARRERRVPTHYYVRARGRTVDIIVDDFFVPDEDAARLAARYRAYVHSWVASAAPRSFPRDGLGLSDFHGFVPLTVLREHAEEWIAALNETGPLTYNRGDRAIAAWKASRKASPPSP